MELPTPESATTPVESAREAYGAHRWMWYRHRLPDLDWCLWRLWTFLRIEFDSFGSAAMKGVTVNCRHQFLQILR